MFEDVLAEPEGVHSADWFVLQKNFNKTDIFIYVLIFSHLVFKACGEIHTKYLRVLEISAIDC